MPKNSCINPETRNVNDIETACARKGGFFPTTSIG